MQLASVVDFGQGYSTTR